MSPLARAPDGQASIEWLCLVALVAVLLGLGAALAQAGYVGRQVTREMARALCRVGQGDCERDHEPCVTASERGRGSMAINLGIVRLGGGYEALVEQRSDGTYAVTRATQGSFGLEGGLGPSARLDVKGVDVAVGAELRASLLGRLEGGRTWIVPTRADADALLGRLRLGGGGAPRAPDVEYGARTLEGMAGAVISARGPIDLDVAGGRLTFDRRSGARIDHRTGRRTVFAASSTGGELEALGGVLGLRGATTAGRESYAVELDASGRPVDLRVVATGSFGGTRDLPAVVQPVAGLLATGDGDGRAYEVTAHLDLTDAGNLVAARGLLRAIAAPGWRADLPSATQALRRRLDERGTVEARILRVRHAEDDVSGASALGGKVGGSVHTEHTETRLLAATSRGLDGRWIPRTDCVGA